VKADVLADKDPRFQHMNFCSVIRGSKWKGQEIPQLALSGATTTNNPNSQAFWDNQPEYVFFPPSTCGEMLDGALHPVILAI